MNGVAAAASREDRSTPARRSRSNRCKRCCGNAAGIAGSARHLALVLLIARMWRICCWRSSRDRRSLPYADRYEPRRLCNSRRRKPDSGPPGRRAGIASALGESKRRWAVPRDAVQCRSSTGLASLGYACLHGGGCGATGVPLLSPALRMSKGNFQPAAGGPPHSAGGGISLRRILLVSGWRFSLMLLIGADS